MISINYAVQWFIINEVSPQSIFYLEILEKGSEEIFFEESEEDEEEDESVYSQEHESENEEPVRISTQNANNNTNQTIIEALGLFIEFLEAFKT